MLATTAETEDQQPLIDAPVADEEHATFANIEFFVSSSRSSRTTNIEPSALRHTHMVLSTCAYQGTAKAPPRPLIEELPPDSPDHDDDSSGDEAIAQPRRAAPYTPLRQWPEAFP